MCVFIITTFFELSVILNPILIQIQNNQLTCIYFFLFSFSLSSPFSTEQERDLANGIVRDNTSSRKRQRKSSTKSTGKKSKKQKNTTGKKTKKSSLKSNKKQSSSSSNKSNQSNKSTKSKNATKNSATKRKRANSTANAPSPGTGVLSTALNDPFAHDDLNNDEEDFEQISKRRKKKK